ncbi:TetR-like C-terminal domain-containing protein [Peribacillus sp. NPDC097295]|uniref:TetR-like C-terminal domain-containing protein n=1 Tax=Peribacillus sp. NPDC097295 TaxID=3364402 RepID=UPI00380EE5B9
MEELKVESQLVLENLDNPNNQSVTPLFQHIIKHRDFYDVLLSENAPIKYLIKFTNCLLDLHYEVIARNVTKGTDFELYLSFSSSATMGMIYHWKKTRYEKSAEEMAYQLTKFFSKDY